MSTLRTYTAQAGLAVGEPAGTTTYTQLTGRAVPYNATTNLGPFTEEIAPGTFTESLRTESRLPLHVLHGDSPELGGNPDTPWPIGVATAWPDQSDGLWSRWLLDSTPEAQDAAARVARGMLRYMSIRFQPDELTAQWTLGRGGVKDHVRWTKGRLISVSLVSTPAYATAVVTDIRSAPPSLAYWQNYLEAIRHAPWAGNTTPTTPTPTRRRHTRRRR